VIIGFSIMIANTGNKINIHETNNTVKNDIHVTNVMKYEVSKCRISSNGSAVAITKVCRGLALPA
jgi:hypothetical protein